jgi:hypothetical protein
VKIVLLGLAAIGCLYGGIANAIGLNGFGSRGTVVITETLRIPPPTTPPVIYTAPPPPVTTPPPPVIFTAPPPPTTMQAPEVSAGSAIGALTLLAGMLAVGMGRRRPPTMEGVRLVYRSKGGSVA